MNNDYKYLRKQLKEMFDAWGQDVQNEDVGSFYYQLFERLDIIDSFKLYRYSPADYYSIRNLETQSVYLSQSGDFNDIFEGIPAGNLYDVSHNDLSVLNDAAYIKCFSETYKSILMWSHYADSHKGICVEYDLKLLDSKSDVLKHLYPVIYCSKRPLRIEIRNLVENMKQLNQAIYDNDDVHYELAPQMLPLFVIKGGDWRYEREWRIIYTKNEMYVANNYNRMIPFACVSGIYLGHRTDPMVKRHIAEIVSAINKKLNRNIFVKEAVLCDSEFKLTFKKTNPNQ